MNLYIYWKNLLRVGVVVLLCGLHTPAKNFMKTLFTDGHRTAKFAKVFHYII